jgi:carboxyl-terminal processing protease
MRRCVVLAILLFVLAAPRAFSEAMTREELIHRVQRDSEEVSALWQQQRIAEAVEILERLAALPGIEELRGAQRGILYNLACGYALLGEPEKGLDSLRRAVDAGFSDVDQLDQDPDLASIRSDPRFRSIVRQLRAAYPRWESPAFQTPYREDLSPEEKTAGLARVWAEVKYGFVHLDRVPDLDWDQLFLDTLPEVRDTRSTAEYYRVLQKLCARLHDGHTSINVPNELFRRMYSRPAIDTRLIEGRVFIVKVLRDSLLRKGIRPGLEILRIDGSPVREFAETNVAPYQSASTPQGAEVATYSFYLLCGPPEKEVPLELAGEDGSTFGVSLPRDYHRILSYERPIEFRRLEDGIGYVGLHTFGDRGIVAAFDSLFTEVAKADALVLDLRQNTGGNGDVGFDILGYLTDAPFPTTKGRVRVYDPHARARGERQIWEEIPSTDWPPAGTKHYAGPVVVLIGPQTGSAAEDFCAAFAAMKRGPLIGAPTAGTTGQPLVYRLPGGGSGIVCTVDVLAPDGSEFVGSGIQPQIAVRTSIADLRAGRDAELEAAVRELRKELKR